jgi:hypothetical protein
VFGQRKAVKTLGYRGLNDLLKGVVRMATELARVAVVRVRHVECGKPSDPKFGRCRFALRGASLSESTPPRIWI